MPRTRSRSAQNEQLPKTRPTQMGKNNLVQNEVEKRSLDRSQTKAGIERFIRVPEENVSKGNHNLNEVKLFSGKRKRKNSECYLEGSHLSGTTSKDEMVTNNVKNHRTKTLHTDKKPKPKKYSDISDKSLYEKDTDRLMGNTDVHDDRSRKKENGENKAFDNGLLSESESTQNRYEKFTSRRGRQRKVSLNERGADLTPTDNEVNRKKAKIEDSLIVIKETGQEKANKKSTRSRSKVSARKNTSENQSDASGNKSTDTASDLNQGEIVKMKIKEQLQISASTSFTQKKRKFVKSGQGVKTGSEDTDCDMDSVKHRSLNTPAKKRKVASEKDKEKIVSRKSQTKLKSQVKKKHTLEKTVKELITKSETSNVKSFTLDKKFPSNIDHTDITAILLHMEGPGMALLGPSTSSYSVGSMPSKPDTSCVKAEDDSLILMSNGGDENDNSDDDNGDKSEDSDEDSGGNWEEVEDHHTSSPKKSQIPDKPIEITLEAPLIGKKRQKKGFDWKVYFQRQLNRFKKELQEDMHKVHLLCLISHGMYWNSLCNREDLQAMVLSLLPNDFIPKSVKTFSLSSLSSLLKWFSQTIVVGNRNPVESQNKLHILETGIVSKSVPSAAYFAVICVILLRSLGFLTRLVMSLQPLPLKLSGMETSSRSKTKIKGNPAKIRKLAQNGEKKEASASKKDVLKRESKRKGRVINSDSERKDKSTKKKTKTSEEKYDLTSVKGKNSSKKLTAKNKTRRQCASKLAPSVYKEKEEEEDSEEDFIPVEDDTDSDESYKEKQGNKQKKSKDSGSSWKNTDDTVEVSSDLDFHEDTVTFRSPKLLRKTKGSKNKKIVSSDSDESITTETTGFDQWTEVYLESEEKWICIDSHNCQLNKPYEIERRTAKPVHYVLAFNNEGTLKDVTARYASQWMTETRKLRIESDWWEETLEPYRPRNTDMEEREDQEMKSHLIQKPLPTSVGLFKNHPLYVLQRHLLKFEAIYPDTSIPVGYVRGEPVYARECVHVLHSRENWLKEGRSVKIGETAYKMVKSRPKWKKPKENPDALDLELFGRWQTEDYIPPPAVDGKVPRNGYGNVELFLPSMLPSGTVHLKIPGLNKVAKKLGIDCAPAMTGWDNHCGFSHPLLDGWIVCEEFKDILLAAWDEEQEIMKQKEAEKREKRALSNWKLLVRGLLIKERLKHRFNLEEEKVQIQEEKASKLKKTKGEIANDVEKSWPSNRQAETQPSHYKVEKL
ncbi:hypothetical protein CHS0354_038511 [Potamilus streckersoni]|uniref:DNA repair protein complementing XP-C cells homolog n=1 Tax=Potamilus streckersoni TaxID=2493646 RepID=A0AAE0S5V1_9BIVA|nr:hypothetical protein CHS0354_038511 [Potamilus streckersoni]